MISDSSLSLSAKSKVQVRKFVSFCKVTRVKVRVRCRRGQTKQPILPLRHKQSSYIMHRRGCDLKQWYQPIAWSFRSSWIINGLLWRFGTAAPLLSNSPSEEATGEQRSLSGALRLNRWSDAIKITPESLFSLIYFTRTQPRSIMNEKMPHIQPDQEPLGEPGGIWCSIKGNS